MQAGKDDLEFSSGFVHQSLQARGLSEVFFQIGGQEGVGFV